MANPNGDSSLGVYYATEDYIGIRRRILIVIVDFGLIAVIGWLAMVLWNTMPPNEIPYLILEWGFPVFAYAYLTVIKASKIRTLGYRLVGAKVLTFKGKRPSMFRMTFRLLLWVFGPINAIFDLIWVGIDQDRQSLRDRFAGTYVVRVNAQPIGKAPIHLFYYQAFGLSLMLPTVCRPKDATSNETSK